MDQALSVQIGDVRTHLGYDDTRAFHCRYGDIGRDSVAAVAVFVGERAVDERYVHGDFSAAEEAGNLAQECRGHCSVAGSDVFSLVSADENAVHKEGILVFRLAEGCLACSDVEAADNLYVPQFFMPPCECFLKDHRDGGSALTYDGVTAAYKLDGLVGRYIFHIGFSLQVRQRVSGDGQEVRSLRLREGGKRRRGFRTGRCPSCSAELR